MVKSRLSILVLILSITLSQTLKSQITPQEVAQQIKRGINIGNTLEPPTEGAWNNGPLQEYYFDDYKTEGFNCIRIPVRWDNHTAYSSPYQVDAQWMNRVEQVVDWGLQRDFFIIINAHHEDWLKQNYSVPSYRARFDSIWSQIALRFKNKSEKLLFEIINEPNGMTVAEVDDLNARIIQIIRQTNPTRIIIYSGNEWSNSNNLFNAAIPQDNFLMAYYHSYDPWNFAGLGNGTWGTVSDVNAVKNKFLSVANWSQTNNIPVMISEFGAVKKCDYNSRMFFYATYVEEAITGKIPFQVWDDGGDFGIYDRNNRKWPEVKDILLKAQPYSPTRLSLAVINDSDIRLTWINRTSDVVKIIIERKTDGSQFTEVAQVSPGVTQYIDTSLIGGRQYYYRVICQRNNFADGYSYPVRIYLNPKNRSGFHGQPLPVPGTIEAEDYDLGGEGLTYHDIDPENIPGAYRPFEGVDIETRNEGGFQVAYTATGEWLEYTINVSDDDEYKVTVYAASLEGGGRLQFSSGNSLSEEITIPSTNSWQQLTPVTTTMNLSKGEQILRASIISAMPFNLDRFVIEKKGNDSVNHTTDFAGFGVFPNPASGIINISYSRFSSDSRVEIFNVLGELVTKFEMNSAITRVPLAGISSGLYVLRLYSGTNFIDSKKIIIF